MQTELRRRELRRPARGAGRPLCVASVTSASSSAAVASRARPLPQPTASLAAAAKAAPAAAPAPSTLHLLAHRPLALLSLVPLELAMFIAGGVAGAIAKTTTAPLDRVRPSRRAPPAGVWLTRAARRLAGQDLDAGVQREHGRGAVGRAEGCAERHCVGGEGDCQDGGRAGLLARERAAGASRPRCRVAGPLTRPPAGVASAALQRLPALQARAPPHASSHVPARPPHALLLPATRS